MSNLPEPELQPSSDYGAYGSRAQKTAKDIVGALRIMIGKLSAGALKKWFVPASKVASFTHRPYHHKEIQVRVY